MCSPRDNSKRADFSSLAPFPVRTPPILSTYISFRHTAISSCLHGTSPLMLSSFLLILEYNSSQASCYHLSLLSCMLRQRYGYALPVKPGTL